MALRVIGVDDGTGEGSLATPAPADVHPDEVHSDSAARVPIDKASVDNTAAAVRNAPAPIPAALLADARRVNPRSPADYGVFRPNQGPNGTTHWGIDIPLDPVTHGAVVAPERMVITNVWTTNATPPFVGYGPAGVVGRGDSGVFHLLAHLDPEGFAVTVGQTFEAGELVALDSPAVGHVHWEVRTQAVDQGPATRGKFTVNPVLWLDSGVIQVLDGNPRGGIPLWLILLGLYILSES